MEKKTRFNVGIDGEHFDKLNDSSKTIPSDFQPSEKPNLSGDSGESFQEIETTSVSENGTGGMSFGGGMMGSGGSGGGIQVSNMDYKNIAIIISRFSDDKSNFKDVLDIYHKLLHGQIPQHLIDKAIFFGSTVPYAVTEQAPKPYDLRTHYTHRKGDPRVFGDLDIYVPVKDMKEMRQVITGIDNFKMHRDSTDMFIAKNAEGQTVSEHREVLDPFYHRDYGFQGSLETNSPALDWRGKPKTDYDGNLTGELERLPISVFPLMEEDGNVNTRGFRFGERMSRHGWSRYISDAEGDYRQEYILKNEVPEEDHDEYTIEKDGHTFHKTTHIDFRTPDLLLDGTLVRDFGLEQFIREGNILGRKVKMVIPEYTIASKEKALREGFKYRKRRDKHDIEFILENADKLGISESRLGELREKLVCEVLKAHDIKNGAVSNVLDTEQYQRQLREEKRFSDERTENWS